MIGALEDGDVASHRVTHQDDGLADDLLYEPVHEHRVRADRGRTAEEGGAAKAGQVQSEGMVSPGELRADRHPVHGVADETVDQEERLPLRTPVGVGEGLDPVYG